MISQQLESICQPINNTFCMELHYNIPYLFTYLLAHLLLYRFANSTRKSTSLRIEWYRQQYLLLDTRASKHCSSCTIKINVIPMEILRGACSLYGFLQHVTDIPDSQLDSGTSWHGDSKEGQLPSFTWICARHFRFK